MSFKDYAALQEEVKSFLWDRADVAAKIPTFITLAESEARRLLATRQMVTRQPFSISSENRNIPCGAETVKSVRLERDEWSYDLDYVTPEQMATYSQAMAPSRPRFYTIQNDRMTFYPAPLESYDGHIIFRESVPSLSDTCKTNWLLENHPDIYLCGALKWGKAWLIDGDQDWATPFYSAIDEANRDQPMNQRNVRLRADDVVAMGNWRHRRYSIYTDGY